MVPFLKFVSSTVDTRTGNRISKSSPRTLLWMNLMRLLDAGTMGGDDGSGPFLASMLAVTFCGIFVTSILIGTITSGIEAKLDELRKGRSHIIESNHTVILGWSEQIFA